MKHTPGQERGSIGRPSTPPLALRVFIIVGLIVAPALYYVPPIYLFDVINQTDADVVLRAEDSTSEYGLMVSFGERTYSLSPHSAITTTFGQARICGKAICKASPYPPRLVTRSTGIQRTYNLSIPGSYAALSRCAFVCSATIEIRSDSRLYLGGVESISFVATTSD